MLNNLNETAYSIQASAASILHAAGANGGVLDINSVNIHGPKNSAVVLFQSTPRVINVNNLVYKGGGAGSIFDFNLSAASTYNLYNLNISDSHIPGGGNLVIFRANNFLNTPNVKIEGCYIGTLAVLACNVSAKLSTRNNQYNNCSNGVVRFNGTASPIVEWYGSDADQLLGSTVAVVATGGSGTLTSGNLKPFGFPIKLDVGATYMDKTVTGQYCFNNGAGRGTLVQNRLVTCNGTNWVQVDVPTNVF